MSRWSCEQAVDKGREPATPVNGTPGNGCGINGAPNGMAQAMGLIPGGLFAMTAAHENARGGVIVRWVQQCSTVPPMVMVAVPLGQAVEPLIRDSRSFALCQLAADDRFTERKILAPSTPGEDALVALVRHSAPSGSPIIERAVAYLDCELMRHIDIEADYALYVGLVRHAEVINADKSVVQNGYSGSAANGLNGSDHVNGANGSPAGPTSPESSPSQTPPR